jgi:hypothetical protein
MMLDPIQLDLTVSKRVSLWLQVCPSCQHERTITYSQAWNLQKGLCDKHCRDCRFLLGVQTVNTVGLALGRGRFHPRKSPYKGNEWTAYNNVLGVVTEERRAKQRAAKLGKFAEESNRWKGGYSNPRTTEMRRDAYKALRKAVFARDNFTCVLCGVRGGRLDMDHIKEWRNYPELRYDLDNCRTLCRPCHVTTDNYGTKAIRKGG